jgi:hypothetical protein
MGHKGGSKNSVFLTTLHLLELYYEHQNQKNSIENIMDNCGVIIQYPIHNVFGRHHRHV